jgi:hypothetical protein
MELELDAKNILEMRMIKGCINESGYSDDMKKQLIHFIDEIIETLNKDNKIEVNVLIDDTSEEDIHDDEEWA